MTHGAFCDYIYGVRLTRRPQPPMVVLRLFILALLLGVCIAPASHAAGTLVPPSRSQGFRPLARPWTPRARAGVGKLDALHTTHSPQGASPIDIKRGAGPAPGLPVDIRGQLGGTFSGKVIQQGHTLRFKPSFISRHSPGNTITVNGVRHRLDEIHYHYPSEHTIDGKRAAMEEHRKYAGPGGRALVVTFFIDPGTEETPAHPLLAHPSEGLGERGSQGDRTKVRLAGPTNTDRFHFYSGGLTTPPYTEGVLFAISDEVVKVPPSQIAAYKTHFESNARDVQPMGNRPIFSGTASH